MDIGHGSSVVSSRLNSCLVISCHFFSTVFFTFFVYDNGCFFRFFFFVSFSIPFSHSCFPSVLCNLFVFTLFPKPILILLLLV